MASTSKKEKWAKAKVSGKKWFDKVGAPVNKVSQKLGAEAFWPMSLDQESDKAARILRSFCIDGFKTDKNSTAKDHIPPEVIQKCRGLAIFTVMRAGLNWSGAGGSGIVVARLPNGGWSAPSGILIHTLGWGLIAGADIYDCVCVINDDKGMEAFTLVRCSLGGEVSAAVGPVSGGGNVEAAVLNPKPVWAYTKARGLYIGVQIDGTVIVERTSENERFYGVEGIKNKQILSGGVQVPPGTAVQLWETLQACEGLAHNADNIPPAGYPAPSDHYDVVEPSPASHQEYEELDHYPAERMDSKPQ